MPPLVTRRRPAVRARRGISLVEVIVAITILSFIAVTMGRFIGDFVRTVGDSNIRSSASDLVVERLEQVKGNGRYDNLEALFNATEPTLVNYPSYKRVTLISRVGGQPSDSVDYKLVTVTVTAPGLKTPVKKSTVIANF